MAESVGGWSGDDPDERSSKFVIHTIIILTFLIGKCCSSEGLLAQLCFGYRSTYARELTLAQSEHLLDSA